MNKMVLKIFHKMKDEGVMLLFCRGAVKSMKRKAIR